MADVVTSQVLENGPRRLVMKFTNYSDGTGETGVKKVDATSATYAVNVQGQSFVPGTNLKVVDVWYDLRTMGLRIQWEASANVDMLVLGGFGHMRFLDARAGFQGLANPMTTGATGSILFTTTNPALNGSYTVILNMVKGVPQG